VLAFRTILAEAVAFRTFPTLGFILPAACHAVRSSGAFHVNTTVGVSIDAWLGRSGALCGWQTRLGICFYPLVKQAVIFALQALQFVRPLGDIA